MEQKVEVEQEEEDVAWDVRGVSWDVVTLGGTAVVAAINTKGVRSQEERLAALWALVNRWRRP